MPLDEKTDSLSPSTAGLSLTGGRAVMVQDVDDIEDIDDLREVLADLIGTTLQGVTDGRLQRLPPKAHPVFRSWVVSSITTIQGFGEPDFLEVDAELEVPAIPSYALYPSYRLTLEFAPRPYSPLQDAAIPTVTGESYYNDDDVAVGMTYAKEWLRYVDVEVQAVESYLEGRKGQMKFRTGSGTTPGGAPGVQFAAAPRMYLPDSLIKIRWYQVPYRYVSSSSSYLRRFKSRVNQTAIEIQDHSWGPGELLFMGYSFARYTPPLPETNEFAPGMFATEKLVDIELTFLETRRSGTDVPTPSNRSWIAAGHNLLPWLKERKFYYATQGLKSADDANTAKWVPTFLSAPYQLLFTDPDYVP